MLDRLLALLNTKKRLPSLFLNCNLKFLNLNLKCQESFAIHNLIAELETPQDSL